MLHLAAYIMMPFMASTALSGPVPNTGATNTTNLPSGAQSPSNVDNTQLINSLEGAATAVDRMKLLPNPSDHVYDFLNPPADAITAGAGGRTVKSDRSVFPALIGTGVSMTLGFIGPCGFNTPHTHPRSSEINIIVEGRLGVEFIAENGAPLIRNELNTMQMTVFPQGALHTEFNPDCTNATFVAGFASEDPGVQQTIQRLFDLDDDLLEAAFDSQFTFDGADIDTFRTMIPKNVALSVDACLKKCNIQKRDIRKR